MPVHLSDTFDGSDQDASESVDLHFGSEKVDLCLDPATIVGTCWWICN